MPFIETREAITFDVSGQSAPANGTLLETAYSDLRLGDNVVYTDSSIR